MSQKLPVGSFKWIEDTSQFYKNFIVIYREYSGEGYFFEVDVQYLEELDELYFDLPFLPKRIENEKVEKLCSQLSW